MKMSRQIGRRRLSFLAALTAVPVLATACQIKTPAQQPVALYEKPAPAGSLQGRVAFVEASGTGNSKVIVMDLATGDQQTLPVPAGHVEDLAWSADGRNLAYALQSSGGHAQIWTSAADGSGARQITHDNSLSVEDPSWSPDGSRLAVAAFGPSGWAISVLDPTTGSLAALGGPGGEQRFPSWAPDGNRIVYSGRNSAGLYKLYAYGVHTHLSQQLTSGPGDDLYPQVGANGQILFTSTRPMVSSPTASQTYVLSSDGNTHTVVSTNSVETWPAWSPDQRHVIVASPHLAVYEASGDHLPDGSLRWKLTNRPVSSPRWTP